MIFTACPNCDAAQVFAWEAGQKTGFMPSRCPTCSTIMWVELASLDGRTYSHKKFLQDIVRPGEESQANDLAARAQVENSTDC